MNAKNALVFPCICVTIRLSIKIVDNSNLHWFARLCIPPTLKRPILCSSRESRSEGLACKSRKPLRTKGLRKNGLALKGQGTQSL